MRSRMKDLLLRAMLQPEHTRSMPGAESSVAIVDLDAEAEEARASLMTEVNRHTLAKLTPDQVYVRSVRAANDVIDSYESRFTLRGLQQLARVSPGAPMARGHRMDGDVYARVLGAQVIVPAGGASKNREQRDLAAASWMRQQFYWPKDITDAENIRARIDGGLWKEVSVHFKADSLPCSICDADIRQCDHVPGQDYAGKKCFWEMEDVRTMLETSFVIRGAQLGTTIEPEAHAGRMEFANALMEVKTEPELFDWWRSGLTGHGNHGKAVQDYFADAFSVR